MTDRDTRREGQRAAVASFYFLAGVYFALEAEAREMGYLELSIVYGTAARNTRSAAKYAEEVIE